MSYTSRSNVNPTSNTPRGGYSGSSQNGITRGLFVKVKVGYTINFYTDATGQSVVGPSGGKRGQSGNPARAQGQYVGVTTGLSDNGFVEVDWVNTWWQTKVFKDVQMSEVRKSWVKIDSVIIESTYTAPLTPEQQADQLAAADQAAAAAAITNTGTASTGLDTTTLGLAAVGAALIFSRKKGKR